MKNKNKSKKVQAYVKSVQKQVKDNVERAIGTGTSAEAKRQQELKKQKEAQAAIEKEMAMLMKAAIKQPPLEPGVDPKSVVCEFFKAGCCSKGDKCKFSHDLSRARKGAKIDIYSDVRGEDEKAAETNADWDQAKLEEVVAKKHGDEPGSAGAGAGAGAAGPKQTEIVCKYFLDAIEKEIYGWFWTCPNGGSACKYRHALPAGFVYKSKKQRDAEAQAKLLEQENGVSIEEEIEEAVSDNNSSSSSSKAEQMMGRRHVDVSTSLHRLVSFCRLSFCLVSSCAAQEASIFRPYPCDRRDLCKVEGGTSSKEGS
jgi:Zinc finger C-x8-C-x5-C-x3-H type (and similar)